MLEVLDKGKAAAVTTIIETRNKHSGELIFENQSTVFIRGAGGFGGKRAGNGWYFTPYRYPVEIHAADAFIFQNAVLLPLPTSHRRVHPMQCSKSRRARRRRRCTGRSAYPQSTLAPHQRRHSLSGDYNPLHVMDPLELKHIAC